MRRIYLIFSAFFIGCAFVAASAQAASFEIDPMYSSLIFKTKHFIGYDIGAFTGFGGLIETNEDNSRITGVVAKVDVRSIDTRNAGRDKALLGPEVLDAEKFPEASFVGKKIENHKLIGDLTIKGKTQEIPLDVRYWGTAKDKEGHTRVGLSARGTFDRKDFGMSFNQKLDRGQMMWGDEVQLLLEIEGVLKE